MSFSELKNSVTYIEQRAFIKICVLMEMTSASIHQKLTKAPGHSSLPLRTVQRWAKNSHETGDHGDIKPRVITHQMT